MPILDPHALEVTSLSPEQTQRYGMRIGQLLQPGDVICLSGELGAGKTTLAAGIGRGWGALEKVTSPTFVIVNEYHRADGAELHHVDCYRLESELDINSSGLPERIENGATLLIEWPEKAAGWLPAAMLQVDLEYMEDERRTIHLRPNGRRFESFMAAFRKSAFGQQVA
ncbi:MAG: tRNA (adenosine(37)-N6)-threonylcarbamoyltransferase complex ATPase subunit type 1 TsaE [Anaerolineales bacterium]